MNYLKYNTIEAVQIKGRGWCHVVIAYGLEQVGDSILLDGEIKEIKGIGKFAKVGPIQKGEKIEIIVN